ncbi:MAG: hypothetical protein RMJ83_01785 [Armatimonadota bacterium]|nr:hypothetical protein [Armatimonadota bacterium]
MEQHPLGGALQSVRELLLAAPAAPSLLELATLLRDLSAGWDYLTDATRNEIAHILQSSQPLTEGAIAEVLEALSAYEPMIGRAAGQAPLIRYPSPRAALYAYEQISLLPADANPTALDALLTAATLTAPNTPLSACAEQLARIVYAGQPFSEYNASVALLLGLAFLQANGVRVTLSSEQASQQLTALAQQQPLQLPDGAAAPDPRSWSDILDELIVRYREPLTRTERTLQQTQLVRLENLPQAQRQILQPTLGPSFEWRYLTLQDLVWINMEVTKSPQRYSYDRLEEATYYQYSYRKSRHVPLQAARFLWGYLKYRPFSAGNLATALIAVLAFLEINGYETHLPVEQAAEWVLQVFHRRKHPLDAIRQIAVPALGGKQPTPLRELVHHLIEHYEPALRTLLEHESALVRR